MDHDRLWQIALIALGAVVAVVGFGVRTLFTWLKERTERNEDKSYQDVKELRQDLKHMRDEFNDRFRSQGHRNEEIKSEISGLTRLLFDFIKDGKNPERRIRDRRED